MSVMPKVGLLAAAPMAAAAEAASGGSLGRAVQSIRGVTRATKRIPGGNVLDAGVGVLDTALNATTQDEKKPRVMAVPLVVWRAHWPAAQQVPLLVRWCRSSVLQSGA
nr:hypothetical protein GCM10020185_04860 [Pseudomonas brassicacearum subsp. brassicacearum]